MTAIFLDTGFLIRVLIKGSEEDARVRQWIAADRVLRVSAVAWSEFLCGPLADDARAYAAKLVEAPEPFTGAHAATSARLFNIGGRRRGSMADCMIASVAMEAGTPLATTHRGDFERWLPEGLKLVED